MPITLPAHAAAILPLRRFTGRALDATALLVGSCAPDLAYVFGFSPSQSHSLPGLVTVCLPVGLLAVVWAEHLVFPVLALAVPRMLGIDWPRLLDTQRRTSSSRRIPALVVGILVGGATHLLWDGFTHAAWWPARVLYPTTLLTVAGRSYPLAVVLWNGSSVIGSAIVLGYLWRNYRAPIAMSGGNTAVFTSIVILTVACGVAGMITWHRSSTTATCALTALTAACAAYRVRHRRKWRPWRPGA